jgi:short-subunit dehydrogenase
LELKNKNIILTGASSGIGYELAKQLAKEGANLALLARRKNVIDSLAEEIEKHNSKIITIQCDVSNKASVHSAFNEAKVNFGEIDMVILNAGTSERVDIINFDVSKADEIYGVNTLGLIYCVKEVLQDFIQRKEGWIVGVSSLSDVRGFPRSSLYCSSKAASSIFLESIRIELKKYNIKIITVKPGFVKTPMTDKNEFYMPFLINVEKAAKIILKGIKKEKRIISFPLPIVLATKVLKILPDSIFDFLLSFPLPSKK